MKVAKIISTCFKRGRVRLETQLTGDPLVISLIVKTLPL